jgi:hypothetical protein
MQLSESVYQTTSFCASLSDAGITHFTLPTENHKIVAFVNGDNVLECWESPRTDSAIVGWLADTARTAGAIGYLLTSQLSVAAAWRGSAWETVMLDLEGWSPPVGFRRKRHPAVVTEQAELHRCHYRKRFMEPAIAGGFHVQVDPFTVVASLATFGSASTYVARIEEREVAEVVCFHHGAERLEVRCSWIADRSIRGVIVAVYLWLAEHFRGVVRYLDLGGIPRHPDEAPMGIRRFKTSTGGTIWRRQVFRGRV